jgi:hypothetical protein
MTALAAAAIGAASYATQMLLVSAPPSGGSLPGLAYGISGTGMIIFAALLGVRRKFPTMRVGRVQVWMRGHVWLGLLSFPMILFHGGFSLGGPLTTVLMVLFTIITLSGIFGLVMQQVVPKLMMEQIPTEVIYEQANVYINGLRQKAAERVESLFPKQPDEADGAPYTVVKEFLEKEIKPFLDDPKRKGLLTSTKNAEIVFSHIRKLVPPEAHDAIEELRQIVEKRRDVARQIKLHYVLHAWLLVHVPLSAGMLVLVFVHAIMALRYS